MPIFEKLRVLKCVQKIAIFIFIFLFLKREKIVYISTNSTNIYYFNKNKKFKADL